MKMEDAGFEVIDWDSAAESVHPGESGVATWRTVESQSGRARMVVYSPGYRADHWCSRGHVILVLDGELETELQDGRRFVLKRGMSYRVADESAPHRSSTATGARLFIVD